MFVKNSVRYIYIIVNLKIKHIYLHYNVSPCNYAKYILYEFTLRLNVCKCFIKVGRSLVSYLPSLHLTAMQGYTSLRCITVIFINIYRK